jgi:CHASE1-domain containing sensor protein
MSTNGSKGKQRDAIKTGTSLWIANAVLILGLGFTLVLVYMTYNNLRTAQMLSVAFQTADLQLKFESRLRTQAQILRSGVALFAASDTVTRQDWHEFYVNSRISRHFPGIQGFGYTHIVSPHDLESHIRMMRDEGFPFYRITPDTEREIYTSIIYLEPFEERNLRAFGFDMYSEPVRRRAMQAAVDSNYAAVSGKVTLVQETEEDVQPGFLIYAPVFRQQMPVSTVRQRRAAIQGWVYSPYRVRDFVEGVLSQWQMSTQNIIRFRLFYGEETLEENLLFDNWPDNEIPSGASVVRESLPVSLNERVWTLTTYYDARNMMFSGNVLFVFFSGIIVSVLLYFLASAMI